MKVAFETTPLFTGRAGVARYVRGLLAALKSEPPDAVEILELGWAVENFSYRQPARALKTLAREWGWAPFVAPRRARGVELVHHTALPIMPFFPGSRHVVTLHDLAVVRYPERFRTWQRTAGQRRLRRIVAADHIIAVSQFTADEAMNVLGLPAHRISVVYEGGGLPPTSPVNGAEAPVANAPASEAGMPADFFLFVGSLEPGKNLALLREIYEQAGSSSLPPLVVVGARWPGVAREGAPPAHWRFLGHVSDAQLARLYGSARALLFPSRYEGFGLPVVEAMAHGCPVICGPVASLPEVGGDAVCYAPLTGAGFGAAMRRVLDDEGWVAQLRAAGCRQASRFSWERCARETLAVYASVRDGRATSAPAPTRRRS
ncbi:MAG TPA: glycosyltransferase family 1 protein [Opitutaceae bacterium]|nr:glycosyltransferase family 1 protein [Opitutaceae bacterium]